jgi:hypothetical protein
LDFDFSFFVGPAAVMTGVLFEVFAEISPASTDADHNALAVLANKADKELDWGFARAARQVIESCFGISVLWPRSRVFGVCGG